MVTCWQALRGEGPYPGVCTAIAPARSFLSPAEPWSGRGPVAVHAKPLTSACRRRQSSQGGSFAVFKVPITVCTSGSGVDPSVECTFTGYTWGQNSAQCKNLYGKWTTGIIVGATAFVTLALCVCLTALWRCRENISKAQPLLPPPPPVIALSPVPYPYLDPRPAGAALGPGGGLYQGPSTVQIPNVGIFQTGTYADLSRPAQAAYPSNHMTWGGGA